MRLRCARPPWLWVVGVVCAAISSCRFFSWRPRSQAGLAFARSRCKARSMAKGPDLRSLDTLFAAEPDRLSKLSLDVAGIHFDWSKTHLDRGWLETMAARSEASGFTARREALFSGAVVNPSEDRAATHVAERGN